MLYHIDISAFSVPSSSKCIGSSMAFLKCSILLPCRSHSCFWIVCGLTLLGCLCHIRDSALVGYFCLHLRIYSLPVFCPLILLFVPFFYFHFVSSLGLWGAYGPHVYSHDIQGTIHKGRRQFKGGRRGQIYGYEGGRCQRKSDIVNSKLANYNFF